MSGACRARTSIASSVGIAHEKSDASSRRREPPFAAAAAEARNEIEIGILPRPERAPPAGGGETGVKRLESTDALPPVVFRAASSRKPALEVLVVRNAP
jgi:hypothetical protein